MPLLSPQLADLEAEWKQTWRSVICNITYFHYIYFLFPFPLRSCSLGLTNLGQIG